MTDFQVEYIGAGGGLLPRWYSAGRDGKTPTLSVVHYTAGSESRTSAEDGAAYDRRRSDPTSCHCFHDPDSSFQELPRAFRAYSAFAKGNRLGIHHELCGTAQTTDQWFDVASDAILWRAARAQAQDCRDFNLEPRRLSVAEVRASWYSYPHGPRGICGHVDITRAFPEDGGDHTDPGTGFPWGIYIGRVQQCYAELTRPAVESVTSGGDDTMKLIFAPNRGWWRVGETTWTQVPDQGKANVNAKVWGVGGSAVSLTDAEYDLLLASSPGVKLLKSDGTPA